MAFKVGDWISHAAFGPGLITAKNERMFVIRFVAAGEKRLMIDFIRDAVSSPSASVQNDQARASAASVAAVPVLSPTACEMPHRSAQRPMVRQMWRLTGPFALQPQMLIARQPSSCV